MTARPLSRLCVTPLCVAHLCVVLGLALAGCAPATIERTSGRSGVDTPKTLRVDHVRLRHAVAFVPGRAEPAAGEIDKLAAFLDRSGVQPNDRVYLEPAAGDRLAARRIGRIVQALDRRGIGAQTLPAAQGTAPGRLNVLVDRYTTVLPDCPDWTKLPRHGHGNAPSSNFGCATVTNLGLMVADPRDLVVGREIGPAEGDPALRAIARYRAGAGPSAPAAPQAPSLNLVMPSPGGGGAQGQ